MLVEVTDVICSDEMLTLSLKSQSDPLQTLVVTNVLSMLPNVKQGFFLSLLCFESGLQYEVSLSVSFSWPNSTFVSERGRNTSHHSLKLNSTLAEA